MNQKQTATRTIIKAILFCIIFTCLLIVLSSLKNAFSPQYERFIYGFMGTIAALTTTVIFLRFDKKSFADIKLYFERRTFIKFFLGTVVGLAITAFMFVSISIFSGLKLELNENLNIGDFLLTTSALIPLAFMEELGFRAYPLVQMQRKAGIRAAVIISAILFILYHIANGWTLVTAVLGTGTWGIVFAIATIRSKGIALSTGIHYSVNVVQAALNGKSSFGSIWHWQQFPSGSVQQKAEWIGYALQAALLIIAVIYMEGLARKTKSSLNTQEKHVAFQS